MNLQYDIISDEDSIWEQKVTKGIDVAIAENSPYAIVVKKGTFEKYDVIEDKF